MENTWHLKPCSLTWGHKVVLPLTITFMEYLMSHSEVTRTQKYDCVKCMRSNERLNSSTVKDLSSTDIMLTTG